MVDGAEVLKKPSAGVAWSLSLAAGLDLCAFVLMAAAGAGSGSLVFFGVCELVLIFGAIFAWKRYFEGLIDYRFRELLGADR